MNRLRINKSPAATTTKLPPGFRRPEPEVVSESMSSSSEEEEAMTIQYIIDEKPSVAIVREFFKQNLEAIKSPEEELFGDN